MSRPFILILLWAATAPCLFSSPLIRHRDSVLDSADRVTYVCRGVPVPFGVQTGTAVIRVPDMFDINDVDVILSIEHTWDSDVSVSLISPWQTVVYLIQNVGSNGDNFTDTYLNDDAIYPLSSGIAPFTGSFLPSQSLSGFNRESGQGEWRLMLEDDYPSTDNGSLIAWTLILGGRIGSAVSGRVTAFENSQPLAGALISVLGTSYSTLSDVSGRYILTVPPDTYMVQCSFAGRCAEYTDTLICVFDDTLTQDFVLAQPVFSLPYSSMNLMACKDIIMMDSLKLANGGDCSLTYETATQTDWLAVLPRGDTIGAGDSSLIRLFISTMGMEPGDYIGSLEFAHNAAGGRYSIPIFLCVLTPSGMAELPAHLPPGFSLGEGYPNPFNAASRIRFALPRSAEVRCDLFNAVGQKVRTLTEEWMEAGNHELLLDGAGLTSGIYFLRMSAGEFRDVRRFVLQK